MEKIENYLNETNLKSIKIYKLFGKKDITLNFENMVKILVAENGAGKTTILNIISSVLTNNYNNLQDIEFEKIEFNFKCRETEKIIIEKKLFSQNLINENKDIRQILDFIKMKDMVFYGRLIFELKNLKSVNLKNLYQKIRLLENKNISGNKFSSIAKVYILKNSISGDINKIRVEQKKEDAIFLKKLKKLDLKTIYFPTYRRIEKEIKNFNLFESDVSDSRFKCGMKDIEEKLKKIKNDIIEDMYIKFDKLNIGILKDESKFSNVVMNGKHLFGKKEKIQQCEEIVASFLMHLKNVYKTKGSKEERLRNFINVCNKYLTHKKFIFSSRKVSVELKDEFNKNISLSSLSSGEKQIVSIFADIYLEEDSNLFVIIDEPELSIALHWQKMLLPDIINSGKCKLLLATTHSPFIFDNEFENFAEELI